jgi:hypothetical protein
MWFETLTGFREQSPEQVRKNISIDGEILKSHVNGRELIYGSLETPSLADLRARIVDCQDHSGQISVREEIADVKQLHMDESNAGSLFQVASQFNLLEMISQDVTPEQGVDRYEHDRTQGPACAVAAGAGTIYRNYFAEVNGQVGQTSANQIDCLADLGAALGNSHGHLWEMRNGYVLATAAGLMEIASKIRSASETDIDDLRKLLRIGVQWHTQVTLGDSKHKVTQAYCSALPVAYSQQPTGLWTEFAQLILEASYEATICTAIANYIQTGNNKVYLTLLGGGAFGNESTWITGAIKRALDLYKHVDLDVVIVSYGRTKSDVQALIRQF